jgi:hypothetical protein
MGSKCLLHYHGKGALLAGGFACKLSCRKLSNITGMSAPNIGRRPPSPNGVYRRGILARTRRHN